MSFFQTYLSRASQIFLSFLFFIFIHQTVPRLLVYSLFNTFKAIIDSTKLTSLTHISIENQQLFIGVLFYDSIKNAFQKLVSEVIIHRMRVLRQPAFVIATPSLFNQLCFCSLRKWNWKNPPPASALPCLVHIVDNYQEMKGMWNIYLQ